MKKRIIAIITAAVLMSVFAGCGNTQQSEPASSSAPAEEVKEEADAQASEDEEEGAPKTVDGWVLNDDETVGYAPDEAKAAFDKALEGFVGQGFDLIAYLGSQVVAGTNHMFLCRGTTVTAEPVVGLKVVTVYADLEGNAEITNVSDFNLHEYVMVDNQDEDPQTLVGGWNVCADAPAVNLPAPAVTYYDAVMDKLLGADYTPLAFLGTHDDGGTSYAFLARQTLVTQNPVDNMCLVYVYAPDSGDPELMNIYTLNLADYNE